MRPWSNPFTNHVDKSARPLPVSLADVLWNGRWMYLEIYIGADTDR